MSMYETRNWFFPRDPEYYIGTEAVGITSIPVIKANNSIAVGVTSIPTNHGISTQAVTVADRLLSGVLVGSIDVPKLKFDKNIRKRNGRKVVTYKLRHKRVS